MPSALHLSFLSWALFAGLLGAGAMTGFLELVTRVRLTEARMMLALGSLLTRSRQHAIPVGCAVHACAGMFFGEIYAIIMVGAAHPGVWPNMLLGAAMGCLQGVLMSLVLVAAVAEVHPLAEFRQHSFPVAVAHGLAHVIFGIVVGAVVGWSGLVTA